MKRGGDTLGNKEFEFPSGIQQEAGMHHQHGQVQLPGKPHRTNLSGLQEKQRVSPSILTFERAVKANSSSPGEVWTDGQREADPVRIWNCRNCRAGLATALLRARVPSHIRREMSHLKRQLRRERQKNNSDFRQHPR